MKGKSGSDYFFSRKAPIAMTGAFLLTFVMSYVIAFSDKGILLFFGKILLFFRRISVFFSE